MSASKKNSRRWARAFGVCLLSVAAVVAAAEEVYRWKDANGQWHYGDKPPAGQQADTVPIAPPPKVDPYTPVATPDVAATPGKGKGKGKGRKAKAEPVPEVVYPGLWSEVEEKKQVLKPRTVREVQRGCSTIVNACAVPGGPDRASCLADVRQCAADPTMEKQDCCPAACSLRYAELRSQGLPDGLAFTRSIYGNPSCVPGAGEAPN